MSELAAAVLAAARQMQAALDSMRFAAPVHTVYAPLRYAWCGYQRYIERYASASAQVLFLGMNPGPFGMAQSGVPFGDVAMVRDWLGITCEVGMPAQPHPQRPVQGFACQRGEVSGSRLWGLFRARYDSADSFFAAHLVVNYCPLLFMEETGRNRTPDKLPRHERDQLLAVCDQHLARVLAVLQPRWLVGIGAFAMRAAQRVVATAVAATAATVPAAPTCVQILHPSPASPAANRGWAPAATAMLVEAGVW